MVKKSLRVQLALDSDAQFWHPATMLQVMLLSLLSLSLSSSPYRPVPGDPPAAPTEIASKEIRVTPDSRKSPPCALGEGIARLPFARGKSFCSLDAYLAHLEVQSAIDLPWWRQIRPGVYEHVKRMPGATPEIATRAALMKRFGFSK